MRPDDVVAPPHERGAYPGIEVVTSDLPQTVPQVEKELVDSTTTEPTPSLKDEPIEASSPPKKKSRKWILISGIAVLLVIIAIAVGVPVGLTKKNSR